MTKRPKRIQVKVTKKYWGDFEGPLTDIRTSIQNAIDDGWEGIENDCEPYEDFYPVLYKHRLETDKEYEKRMRELERRKARELSAKEKRRQEYERLKKEFGDD